MRADAALVLMAMGYSSLHDFSASTNEAGDVVITWLAATPMPSEVEIDAFVNPAAALATRTAQAYKAAATAGIDNGQLQAGDKLERLCRALALVVLDEINLVRAALVPALPARTTTQLVNAIKAKIAASAE